MLDTKEILEKKFHKDTHRLIAETQLQRYSTFFEKYNGDIHKFQRKVKPTTPIKPISINLIPSEEISLLKLVISDNKLLSRILVSLSSVCNEAHLLATEAREQFFTELLYYGEFQNFEENKGVEGLAHMDKLFELLQKIQLFVKRAQDVIVLILQQLCAIIGRKFNSDSNITSFPEMLECLAELLVVLLTLDALLHVNVINDHWKVYKRAMRAMLHNSHHFSIGLDDIRVLDKKILDLEDGLLTGMIMKRTMDKCLDEKLLVEIKSCNLTQEITLYIQQLLADVEKDDDMLTMTQIWLQANALFVLHYHLNGAYEKKVLKRLIDANRKISACVLAGNIVWLPEQFLIIHVPALGKTIDLKATHTNRCLLISQRSQNLNRDTNTICMQACYWFIQIEKKLQQDASKFKLADLQKCYGLLQDGMKLCKRIAESIKWITNLHADEGKPMAKSVLLNLCKMVEILVGFRFVFQRNCVQFACVLPLILQQLTHKALSVLGNIKKSFVAEKMYKQHQLDVLSALVVAEKALKGPNTNERLLVTKLALSSSGLHNDTLAEVRQVVQKLFFIVNLLPTLNALTNCSFLYWHQVLFPVYFNKLATSRTELTRSYLLLAALSHSTDLATSTRNNADKYVFKSMVEPLRESIEANLRHQTHLHLSLNPLNPFQTPSPLPTTCKQMQPVLFSNTYVNMRHDIEHYLSSMFYNLTTVVLHDWRTYGEMRRLAVLQYGLRTVEDNLPVQTLEQGLDVLEIMRNINIFVGKYMYNLNNQVFVEEASANKHLNTIGISHVANSIRTHGIGIMSTTVNFTYQFLQNKFYTFSQFMYDEQIKSRLLKDLRYFTEHKSDLNQMYPYSRADAFNHGIRKLGLNETGLSYLDLFRKLITQIGNAMGYVRLIRSGGKRCIADGACFLPDLQNASIEEFSKDIDEANLEDLTKQTAEHLKREVHNLADNFEEATEYFKLLINAFASVFRNPDNVHLRNFYIIIPPLTINYIEHVLNCKERLNKNNRDGSAFTDDGFAMGIAYIVELLDQRSQFNSLHWFQSVWAKQHHERRQLEVQKAQASKEDNKLQQALSLTEKRIQSIETEFKLLYYSVSSARIFFEN